MTNVKRGRLLAAIAFAVAVQCAAAPAQQSPVSAGAVPPARSPLARSPSAPLQLPSPSAPAPAPPGTVPAAATAPGAAGSTAVPDAARSAAGIGPLRELSPWSMFLSADILVKAVIIGLVFGSLVTWTLLLAKTLQIFLARRDLGAALARLAKARSLSEAQTALGATSNVLSELLAAALEEVELSSERATQAGIKERAASHFSEIVRIEARSVRSGMAIIATIGATAPFVGLFGTVWGIMNSFIGISKAQTTNLAVVAPGIAEALLATAIGLITAIPAVMIYNHFSRATRSYLDLVGRGSGAVGRILSRDLDCFDPRIAARAAE